jgi:hypothetical protein
MLENFRIDVNIDRMIILQQILEIACHDVWIPVAQNMDWWQAVIEMIMKLPSVKGLELLG